MYTVEYEDMKSVADAIRAKSSTAATLMFPDDFISTIQSIPTGGGGGGEAVSFTVGGTDARAFFTDSNGVYCDYNAMSYGGVIPGTTTDGAIVCVLASNAPAVAALALMGTISLGSRANYRYAYFYQAVVSASGGSND